MLRPGHAWTTARDGSKVSAKPNVGDMVTVEYRMTAMAIEVANDKPTTGKKGSNKGSNKKSK